MSTSNNPHGAAPSGEPLPFPQLAEIVLGWDWRHRLSAEFGINPRSLQRWAAGQDAPPDRIVEMLSEMKRTIERYRQKPKGETQ